MRTLKTLLITIMALFGVAMSQPAEAGKGRETAHYCFTSEGRGFCLELVATENEVVGSDTLADRLENAAKKAYPNSTELLTANWIDALRLGIMEQSSELSVAGMERKSTQVVLRDVFAALHPQTASPSTPAPTATPAEPTVTTTESGRQVAEEAPQLKAEEPASLTEPTSAETQVEKNSRLDENVSAAIEERIAAARAEGYEAGKKDGLQAVTGEIKERDRKIANLGWLLTITRKDLSRLTATSSNLTAQLDAKSNELGATIATLGALQTRFNAATGSLAGCEANLANTTKQAEVTHQRTIRLASGASLFALVLGFIGGRISKFGSNRNSRKLLLSIRKAIQQRIRASSMKKVPAGPPVVAFELEDQPTIPPEPKTIPEKSSKASQALEALDAGGYFDREAAKTKPAAKKEEILEVVEEPEPPTVNLKGDPLSETANLTVADTLQIADLIKNFMNTRSDGPWQIGKEVIEMAVVVARGIANGPVGISIDHQQQASRLTSRLEAILDQRSTAGRSTGEIRSVIAQLRKVCAEILPEDRSASA